MLLALLLAAAPTPGCFSARDCALACDKDDADACYTLGMMHLGGIEAVQDSEKVRDNLGKACAFGVWRACRQQKDPRADSLTAKACASETLLACSSPAEALPHFIKRCDARQPKACEDAARHLAEVAEKPDPVKALALREKACGMGALTACYDAGNAVLLGQGVPKDVAKGKKLILKACDGGYAAACARYALTLGKDDGPVPKDPAKSAELQKKACSLGYALGCRR